MMCRCRARPYWGERLKRATRKLLWDRGGVSEVLGTILTLTITVVLFSGIIAMVNEFPAPGDNVYTDFTATIEPWNSTITWNGAFIHITNTGGQQMTSLWTIIVLTIDDYTYTLNTTGTMIDDGRQYGLGPLVFGHRGNDNGDDTWDTGERWTLFRNNTAITQASDVSVMILDSERNAMVWNAQIQGSNNVFGPIISNIKADSDIRTLRSDPIQFGREFYIYAEVNDPDGDLDIGSVTADLSSILPLQTNVVMTDANGDGIFMGGPIIGPNSGAIPIGYHIAIVKARDIAGMRSIGSARIAVGMDLGGQPNLRILSTDISVNPESPINGQTTTIAVTVKNYGGWCNGNVTFFDIVGSVRTKIGMMNFSVSQGPTQVTSTISWKSSPGGEHTIEARAVPIGAIDPTPEDNWNSTNITVLPKILLVDDDNHPADLSVLDTVSYMRGALESSDFGYDLYTVGPHKDGPGYQFGQTKMIDYDIIIWMTGYQKVKTLTANDQANITAYLNGVPRGGSLWMIGQYLYQDPALTSTTFFTNVLKATNPTIASGGPTNPLMGVLGNPVSSQWNTTFIPVITRVTAYESSYQITPAPATGAEITFKTTVNGTADTINYENTAKDSRIVFCPWEFSRIRNTGHQTQVAYRVLKWLGNITLRSGNDLAVSQQILAPDYVFFNQIVRVDAEIRNNGETDQIAQVGLFLDGGNEAVEWISAITIPGRGGSVAVSGNWTARELGTHVLKWKVDPNNLITETNEGNNEVPNYITTGEVFVEFRILIVDDDSSANNNNGTATIFSNDTAYLTNSLHRLGYRYESPKGNNTVLVVPISKDGPTISILKDYSAVLWICGDSISGLTKNDTLALETYVNNNQGLLWLSGSDIWSGVAGVNLTADMGISGIVNNTLLSGTMRGVDNSPISHGMNISIRANPNADQLIPSAGASGVFYQSLAGNRYCAVMYSGGTYKGFTSAFNMSTLYGSQTGYISGNNATDEMVYMLLRWMGKPDTRDEVRITERDYFVSDWHPQIGGAYIVRATVHNVGANVVNVLVRFMDGSTQIGAQSVSITPDGQTSAELIWRPLFAGQRQISILVDPINDVDEIFQWFNNNRTFSIYVYFFWDDMESGAGKWAHSATVININGEGPLDFLGVSYTTVNTDVIGTWDWARTSGVQNTTSQYHSSPNSFYMEEPTGDFIVGQTDLLVSIVLDTSKSMENRVNATGATWLEVSKVGARYLVDGLSDNSAVSIYTFGGANPTQVIAMTSLVGVGRTTVNNAIAAMGGSPQTPLWDAVGMAYMSVHDSQALPQWLGMAGAVVVLTDGADYKSADVSASDKPEEASSVWAPWGPMSPALGYPTVSYTNHMGKYSYPYTDYGPGGAIGPGGLWKTTSGGGNRKGLLYSDIPMYTIGLALEHFDTISTPTVATWPGNGAYDHTYAVYTGPGSCESGTTEYNMWRMANTSHGEYFYCENAESLIGTFGDIGTIIGSSTGFNQTRSATPAPETRATNEDKQAASPAVDLSQYQSATFSFWHKYNMLSGGNGGIVGVEVLDTSVIPNQWKFLYIIPPGAYTGGIYYGYDVRDDFDNPIKWCFNGISGRNTFAWDYTSVDVLPLIPAEYRGNVRLCFKYVQFGGGTGVGWYIDDVKLEVSRADSTTITNSKDIWNLTNALPTAIAHSGHHYWSNVDPATGEVKTGIDNSLMTNPIDLTNAKNVYLSAYFKFNFNKNSGAPPDGFRVEISNDGGATWETLNFGIRSSHGVSGTEADNGVGGDGKSDGKSYTGLTDNYDRIHSVAENLEAAEDDGYWVSANSMSRLSIDLSSWSGHQVILRFRMISNNLAVTTYPHNNNNNFPDPGFGGFYIDDVNVYGQTIFG
jgi:hypothetical protein